MSKVRLGGIKAFENGRISLRRAEAGRRPERNLYTPCCRPHKPESADPHCDNGVRRSITAVCTGDADGFSSYIHWKESHGECNVGKLLRDVSMLPFFPIIRNLT